MVSAWPPFRTLTVLETGPITNHVAFVTNAAGRFAYVTVGGRNEAPGIPPQARLSAEAGRDHQDRRSAARHLGFRRRRALYVGLENGDSVQAIDTATNRCVATIPVGQLPQALVYVADAVVSDKGTANLNPLV